MVKETWWYRKRQIFWWCEEDARIILHIQSSTQSMQHFLQKFASTFSVLPNPFPATTLIPTWTQWHLLMKMECYLLCSGCHQGRDSVSRHTSNQLPQRDSWSATGRKHKCLWYEAMPVTQQPSAREPMDQHGPQGTWVAAESSAAILHQGLARATWPPLPETAQAALKTHSFILMHRFTYSCILNRSTNGHNWIHYWVIRALSHCLCSVTWCCGNAQEEQTGQRHGQWQGL